MVKLERKKKLIEGPKKIKRIWIKIEIKNTNEFFIKH
jgi:hypothetical protein